MPPIKNKKQKSIIIAEYFIRKNQEDNKGLSNKKLQKLLYYSQAWSLVINDKKLFNDDIEAWVHGPAVPTVYSEFKKFGFDNINIKVSEKELSAIATKDKTILDEVWRVYGKFDASYLEMLSHSETPWQEARAGLPPNESSSNKISLDTMREYYGKKLKKKS